MRGTLLGGRYRIQNKIGEGGMAYVYVALDEKLQRKVAIKIMHRHMADNADLRKRFFQEAQAISSLHHPNILEIYDFSGEQSEDLWIVTEILQGVNLSEFITSFPGKWLHPVVALIMTREILKALEKAHHEGLVHRDVKPENIMVLNAGKIKLMDFGIAKNTRGNSITATGTFMGSPSYMSPEQIRGKSVDQRSDIYSLGVLLYEIITGKLPYSGNTTHDVVLKICEGKFKEPKIYVPNLPEDINKLITKAMAKYPSNRYQEARSFASDIETFLTSVGFEESNIELERYFKDRERFEARLRDLDFTNRATVAAKIELPSERIKTKIEMAPTKTHHTRLLSQEKTAHADVQVPVNIAVQQNVAPVSTKQTEVVPAERRNFQHTAALGQFKPTQIGVFKQTGPGHLNRKRARPRTPKRHLSQQVVYKVSTYVPARSDTFGLLAGVILVGAILFISVFGFMQLREKISRSPVNATKPLSKVEQIPARNSSRAIKTLPVAPVADTSAKREALPTTTIPRSKQDKDRVKDTPNKKPSTDLPSGRNKTSPTITPQTTTTAPLKPEAKPTPMPTPVLTPVPSPAVTAEAQLRISSQPAAEVYIDGQRLGTTVDRTSSSGWLKIPAKGSTLQLRRAGYQTYTQRLTPANGQKLDLGMIKLTANASYELSLSASKQPVRVTISNLSDHSQRSFVLSGASQTQSLAAGRYKVRFDYQGEVIERNITLSGSDVRKSLAVTFK